MRQRHPTIVTTALLLAVLLTACASIPPDRAVLNSIETIKASAVSTMTVIGGLYMQGQITEAQKAQAITIYNKLQAGCKAVAAGASTVTTVQQGTDLTAPLQALATQLSALLVQFQTIGGK